MKGFMSFLQGIILGTLVGSTVAILLAPSSGEELRNQMQERAEKIQNEVKRASEEKRMEMEQQLASLRSPRKPTVY